VEQTGVTCYTCHRGQPVPAYTWNVDPGLPQAGGMSRGRDGQNIAAVQVGLASLPNDPFTAYLRNADNIRVVSTTALPAGSERNIKQTEATYGLMIHMSEGLGVGCTHCHNSRSFSSWDQSSPQRALAWYGIRMVRDLNTNYVAPLATILPAERLGPTGDAPMVNCTTCHQGVYKPLYGVSMLKDYPALAAQGAPLAAAAAAAPAAAPEPAAVPGHFGYVLFAVGKKDLGAEAVKVIEAAAKALKDSPGVKVDLSGFADKTGNPDKNLELAKLRAFAVRDALKTAGVAVDRINLKKPEFAIGGVEADARRVEINAQK
jgi:photosynthetic reaction center cytochrome c subunit